MHDDISVLCLKFHLSEICVQCLADLSCCVRIYQSLPLYNVEKQMPIMKYTNIALSSYHNNPFSDPRESNNIGIPPRAQGGDYNEHQLIQLLQDKPSISESISRRR